MHGLAGDVQFLCEARRAELIYDIVFCHCNNNYLTKM